MFSCLFEIVSAYGTVGLSLGYPTINASFSAEFKTLSKLIIIAMMLRGRHRGLPYALDRAVLLPSENLHKKESEEAARRLNRRSMSVSKSATIDRDFAFPDTDGSGVMNTPVGRRFARRDSEMSGSRGTPASGRERRLSTLIASGLSAGPTMRKFD